MSRWIDAEWLKRFFESSKGKGRITPIDTLLVLIDDSPSIDIIFCKDCKHWNDSVCYHPRAEIGDTLGTDANGFCSWGEREGE